MTFVILSGGIDLSVGSVIALTTMVSAALVEHHHWSAAQAIPLVLALGTVFGAFMGWLIQRFRLQPFIVTLAGMFRARGLCCLISIDSISITDATYTSNSQARLALWSEGPSITIGALLALGTVAAGISIAHAAEFGRTVFTFYMLSGYGLHAALLFVFCLLQRGFESRRQ